LNKHLFVPIFLSLPSPTTWYPSVEPTTPIPGRSWIPSCAV
jgi:hypothetical protein